MMMIMNFMICGGCQSLKSLISKIYKIGYSRIDSKPSICKLNNHSNDIMFCKYVLTSVYKLSNNLLQLFNLSTNDCSPHNMSSLIQY